MFTGIVQGCGIVRQWTPQKKSWRLVLEAPKKFPLIKIGGSISVNGACLTVVKKQGKFYHFDLIAETLRRTSFKNLKEGGLVNLEPALRKNDRIEGHFVQGHVDGVGVIQKIIRRKQDACFVISFPSKLRPYLVEKGSITVHGVSLSLGTVKKNKFHVYLIPHTLKLTTFQVLKVGDFVNLEADLLVKLLKKSIVR